MKILILISAIFMFSCASVPSNSLDGNVKVPLAVQKNDVTDLTTEIRKYPGVHVRGIGAVASVYLRNQRCSPLFILDGVQIHNYYALYNLVSPDQIEDINIIQARQAAIYGLRSSSGVLIITTKKDSLASR